MKRLAAEVLFCVLTAALFQSCRPGSTIRIGFIAELTGPQSELGVMARSAAELAVAHANLNAKKKFELVSFDSGSSTSNLQHIFDELRREKISAVIGPFVSRSAGCVITNARQDNLLIISPSISATNIYGIDDMLFTLIPSCGLQAENLAAKMHKDGIKNCSIIFDSRNRAYSFVFSQIFSNQFVNLGGRVQSSVDLSSSKFSVTARIAAEKSDAVVLISSGHDSAGICQQLTKIKYQGAKYAGNWSLTRDFLRLAGKSAEGTILTGIYEKKNKSKKSLDFRKEFENKFGRMPDFISIYSFEAAELLITQLRDEPDADSLTLKQKILNMPGYQGIEEFVVINQNGEAQRKSMFYSVKNNNFEILEQASGW